MNLINHTNHLNMFCHKNTCEDILIEYIRVFLYLRVLYISVYESRIFPAFFARPDLCRALNSLDCILRFISGRVCHSPGSEGFHYCHGVGREMKIRETETPGKRSALRVPPEDSIRPSIRGAILERRFSDSANQGK